MIKALSDDTLVTQFLPLLNDILLTGNISPTLKGFNVWALEKETNTGSILELEGKLNIPPYCSLRINNKNHRTHPML
jgi:hypothetical protein